MEIFLAVDTQWRSHVVQGRLVLIGLDYTAVRAAMAWSRVRMGPAEFRDLRLMEGGALQALAEQR